MAVTIKGFGSDWSVPEPAKAALNALHPTHAEVTASVSAKSTVTVDGTPVETFAVDSAPGIMAPAVITPPTSVLTPGAEATWPVAGKAWFTRFTLPVARTYRYFGFRVNLASGNIQVGVVKLDGLNYTRVMNSGIIPSTDGTVSSLDLGATELAAGDYALFFWADNTTINLRWGADYKLASLQASREFDNINGVPPAGTFTGAWNSGRYITGLTLAAA